MTAIITGKKGHPTVFDLRSSSYMGTGCDDSAFAGKGRFVYSFQTVDAKNATLLLNGVYLTLSSCTPKSWAAWISLWWSTTS